MLHLPRPHVYNTCWHSVGHFDTGVGLGGLGDPLDAGKHALQLLSALSVVTAEFRLSYADNMKVMIYFGLFTFIFLVKTPVL